LFRPSVKNRFSTQGYLTNLHIPTKKMVLIRQIKRLPVKRFKLQRRLTSNALYQGKEEEQAIGRRSHTVDWQEVTRKRKGGWTPLTFE